VHRRTLLGTALTAGVASALAPVAATAADSAADSAAGQSHPFDLTAAAAPLFTEAPLHDATVLQSFGFDDRNHRVYAVQLMAGGTQLPGEDAPVSGAQRAANGDLCLTELDETGRQTGYMYLPGFGHGVQIGVQPAGRDSLLWTETASNNENTATGWGTRLTRFPFRAGTVLSAADVQQYALLPDVDRTTCNVDMVHRHLVMRYRSAGAFRYGVFGLDGACDGIGHDTPVYDVAQPTLPGTFQGFAAYGRFLYLLTGDAYGAAGSTPPVGDTYLTAVDLTDGQIVDQQPCTALPELSYREPEGVSVRVVRGQAKLCFGFASGVAGDRRATVLALG